MQSLSNSFKDPLFEINCQYNSATIKNLFENEKSYKFKNNSLPNFTTFPQLSSHSIKKGAATGRSPHARKKFSE